MALLEWRPGAGGAPATGWRSVAGVEAERWALRPARVDRLARITLTRKLLAGQPTPGGSAGAGGVAQMHRS
jgi:hypothetical protein